MFSPNQEQAMLEERKQRLLHSARMHQLYREADEQRAHFGARLMVLVGDLMISGGQKLKARSSVRYMLEAENS